MKHKTFCVCLMVDMSSRRKKTDSSGRGTKKACTLLRLTWLGLNKF